MVKYIIRFLNKNTMQTIYKVAILGIFLMLVIPAIGSTGIVNAQYYGCTSRASEKCMNNNLYWYDSCGNIQEISQTCSTGCYNGATICGYNNNYNYNYNYNYNNYSKCTYHAYKLCAGNSVYWYSGCNQQQDLYQTCGGGQTCQYGQCTFNVQPIQHNTTGYVAYSRTICSGSTILWYDSFGVVSGTYKKCADKNSCTLDSCSGNGCSNILKCDGSTCAVGSADHNTHCLTAQPQTNPATQPNTNPTETPTINPNQNTTPNTNLPINGLSAAFFVKQNAESNQWQKTTDINSNNQVYFMISASNTSANQIDNVSISANIPTEITSLGNLKLNGVSISGDIVSGINIGSVAGANTKLITFEGKTQSISADSTKQAISTITVSGNKQTDSISINLKADTNQNQIVAAVSNTPSTSGFMEFLKKWYTWILIGLALSFIFIVVYKRLSSNV